MTNYFFKPSPFLAPFVEYYFVIEEFSATPESGSAESVKVFPSPQCEMVFSYADPVRERWFDQSLAPSPGFAIGGYATKPVEYLPEGAGGVIMVGFKPWGIQCFLDFEVKEIMNANSDMSLHYGREVLFVEEKLREAGSVVERIRIVEAFLAGKIRRHRADPAMVHAVELIAQSCGTLPVEQLARRCFISRRQFLRRFEAGIGIPPKTYSRIVRFQQVFSKMDGEEAAPDWGTIAYEAGYFDQAHFINDFREFSGYSPEQFQKGISRSPVGRFFDENVQPKAAYGKIYL
ncbi:MAG: helix-turn-helix transcriptional regulator [Bacteroidetes bacterium]|nr:helix-turn-helix transcriptional regulator [Bacteroidota bacterium]